MANSKVISTYLLLCFVVLCDILQARPVEFGNPTGRVSANKLLQALAKQHSNSPSAGKLDKALMLRDLLYPTKTFQAGDNSEARQVSPQDNGNLPYSPLELLQALADYETSDDYYQDQANTDGLYYTDGQDGWFDGPILPKVSSDGDEELNKLLINYLYDHYNKMNEGDNDDEEEDGNVEKRRQKIVIKEDFVGLTTPSTPVASTASPRKAKLVHKPGKVHHGQKEVPLLRPANAAESKQKDWPEELEENNLDEEASLKEMRSQSRPVRDVLTSQLDGLREEAQLKSGAAPSAKEGQQQ